MKENNNFCRSCILPNGFLGITLDSKGKCNYCNNGNYKSLNWSKVQVTDKMRESALKDWHKTINSIKKTKKK